MNFTYVFQLEYGKCKRIPKNFTQIDIHATSHEIPIILLGICSVYMHIYANKLSLFHSRSCARTVTFSTSLGTELLSFIFELSFMS